MCYSHFRFAKLITVPSGEWGTENELQQWCRYRNLLWRSVDCGMAAQLSNAVNVYIWRQRSWEKGPYIAKASYCSMYTSCNRGFHCGCLATGSRYGQMKPELLHTRNQTVTDFFILPKYWQHNPHILNGIVYVLILLYCLRVIPLEASEHYIQITITGVWKERVRYPMSLFFKIFSDQCLFVIKVIVN